MNEAFNAISLDSGVEGCACGAMHSQRDDAHRLLAEIRKIEFIREMGGAVADKRDEWPE